MAKDLEKCQLTQKAFDLKSASFDSLTNIHIDLFSDLKTLHQERKILDEKLKNANAQLVKATKQKRTGWLVPGLTGVIGGLILGVSL